MTPKNMKIDLLNLGKTQMDVIAEINSRFKENIDKAYFSSAYDLYSGQQKAERVKKEADIIISEWKAAEKGRC